MTRIRAGTFNEIETDAVVVPEYTPIFNEKLTELLTTTAPEAIRSVSTCARPMFAVLMYASVSVAIFAVREPALRRSTFR